jgi:glycosyltransferase involved in cell wall biosynthesis
MKLALVHDYLTQYGGAERVLQAFEEVFPDSPIYTLVYDEKKMGRFFDAQKIKTSFLQNMWFVKKHHRNFLMFMPLAVEQFDLSKYDIVLSDSASYAKGIITRPKTFHICYCHTPMRYAWDDSQRYIREFPLPKFVRPFLPLFISYLRIWDKQAASRVDKFLANSEFVAKRIKKYYKKDAEVLYPPVDTDYFNNNKKPGDHYLMVGRLISYKKFDLGVKAFNKLGLLLKIAGTGPELKKLKAMAGPNIEFLGELGAEELRNAYANSKALIFPQEEDFGLVSVESLASGRPVVAYKGGGALEIVVEGENGLFFDEQTEDSLIEAVKKLESMSFDPQKVALSAKKFDKKIFKKKIAEIVEGSYKKHQ